MFHDFCEDAACLVRDFGIKTQSVFDSQIAHRLLLENREEMMGTQQEDSKKCASLNDVLSEYLDVQNDQKSSIQSKMKKNPFIWEARPLEEDMIDYAA